MGSYEAVRTDVRSSSRYTQTREPQFCLPMYNKLAPGFVGCVRVGSRIRCIVDDPRVAGILYQRVLPYLPPTWTHGDCEWDIQGANERLRVLRYFPGEKFEPHYDGMYVRPDSHPWGSGDTSFITLQVYLNNGSFARLHACMRFTCVFVFVSLCKFMAIMC
jgi:hypothetical protein